MKKIAFDLVTALICILVASFLNLGIAGEKPHEEQKKVVDAFCRLDLNGGLLSTKNSKRSGICEYISLSEGPFPAWDNAILVAGYKILRVSSHNNTAEVLLRYDVIGEIGCCELVIMKKKEETRFRLRRINGAWKIIDPNNLQPHISVETAINHLQYLVDSGGNNQPEVPLVIEKLRKLK